MVVCTLLIRYVYNVLELVRPSEWFVVLFYQDKNQLIILDLSTFSLLLSICCVTFVFLCHCGYGALVVTMTSYKLLYYYYYYYYY